MKPDAQLGYCFSFLLWCCIDYVSGGSRSSDFTRYFSPHSVPSRTREFDPAHRLPGNKQSDGNPGVVDGINLPSHKTQTSTGLTDFHPFDHRFGFGVNRDGGDSTGFGMNLAPNGNPHNIPIDMMYPALVANGGTLPRFEENPLIGPFDPFVTGFGVGVAHENINTNFIGALKFPDMKSKKMFDLAGGFSKNARYFGGGIDVPLMGLGQKMLVDGKIGIPNSDIQVSHSHNLANANPLDIPIDQYYPFIVANPQLLFPADHINNGRNIPVVLNSRGGRRSKRAAVTLADIVYSFH